MRTSSAAWRRLCGLRGGREKDLTPRPFSHEQDFSHEQEGEADETSPPGAPARRGKGEEEA
jgi:hypothetical protein